MSVSGCISTVDPDDSNAVSDKINVDDNPIDKDKERMSNNSGSIEDKNSNKSKDIEGSTPRISINAAKEILDNEIRNRYSMENVQYTMTSYEKAGIPYYNITIKKSNQDSNGDKDIGTAIMNADTGEIIDLTLEDSETGQKIYSANEAGAFIDIVYKGKEVSVREHYPYYSPQTDKIYYSQEEEAEDLIKLYDDLQ